MAEPAHSCPMCGQPASPNAAEFPFCSDRCRTQDLANWSSGEYRIPVPRNEADEDWDVQAGGDEGEQGSDE